MTADLWIAAVLIAAVLITTVLRVRKLLAWNDKQAADEAEHQRWLRDAELARALKADAHQPVRNGYPAIAERLALERDWQDFVQGHPLGDEEAAQ